MRLTNFAALMDRDNKAMKYFGGGPQNATGERSSCSRGRGVRKKPCMHVGILYKKKDVYYNLRSN